MAHPPGPEMHPMLLMYRWIRTPFEFLEQCHERYGDIFTVRWPMIPDGLVALSDPAMIKEVFALGPDEAHAGEANVVLKPFLGAHSLLLLDGAPHLRHRKMILPAFHGERMLAYGKTMMDLADDAVDRLPIGRAFPVHSAMQSLTMQVIVRTVFGVEEGPRFAELSDVLAKSLDASAWPPLLFPFMQHDLGPLSPWGRWIRLRNRASELVRGEIRRARESNVGKRTDVLAMMLQAKDDRGELLGEDEIHDELVTLLVAGHETTATSLAWALRWLLPNRKLLGELRDEIASASDDPAKISKLELLDDVVKETLRLQPVIPMVGRVIQQPMRIGGYDFESGLGRRADDSSRAPSRVDLPARDDVRSATLQNVQAGGLGVFAVRWWHSQMRRRVVRDLRNEDDARDAAPARRDAPRANRRPRRAPQHHAHAVARSSGDRDVEDQKKELANDDGAATSRARNRAMTEPSAGTK